MTGIENEIKKRRTFAIISHPDAGKTTLTEKFLLYGGAINLAGSVKGKRTSKHAVSDWMEIEKQRGISVTSSVLQFNYDDYCINIFAQGLATYFDSIAYENKVYIEIQDIELDEYANEESNYYYNYTVKLKIISDEMSVITEGSGKIDLIKELNDNYKVSYIKKLSNGKIKKAIEEMWIYLHIKELQEIYDEKEANNIKDGLIECFKKSKIV